MRWPADCAKAGRRWVVQVGPQSGASHTCQRVVGHQHMDTALIFLFENGMWEQRAMDE